MPKLRIFARLVSMAASLLTLVAAQSMPAQVSVLTHHNDLLRTGQNLNETYLTPKVVASQRFGQLFSQPLDGVAIAEPLYVPSLQINGATHNVVFVVTLHDGVYAFDADSPQAPLWYTSLINPPSVTTVPIADQGCIGTNFTEMGILGTPVIDPNSNEIFLVAKTLESGQYIFRLHALNILTGQEVPGSPVRISATYTTSDNQTVTFVEQHRMNRPALLLLNGVVYIEFGTMGCKGAPPSTGWMMAYDEGTLDQVAVLDVGPSQAYLPGIWMAGDGPAVDSSGYIYLATGNGLFDYNVGGLDFGDTVMKLNLTGTSLGLVDYFTPYNQADLDTDDLDLGSSGVVLLPTQTGPYPNLAVIAGKQGMIYLLNQDALGEYNSSIDEVLQEIPFNPNVEENIDGGIVYWNGWVYVGGAGPTGTGLPVEQYSVSNSALTESAVTPKKYNFFSLFSISANGSSDGILWGVQQEKGAATLVAFNASNLDPIYQSPQITPTLHFVTPMIANGKVYVTTTTSLVASGLLSTNAVAAGDNQTATAGSTLTKRLIVKVTSGYTGAALAGVTVNFSDGGAGGTFSNPAAVTNSSGYAGTTYTLPPAAGTYPITASNTGLTTADFTETATATSDVH